MEIATTEQLKAYLDVAKVESQSVQQLSGGTFNFVWRLIDESGKSVIVKHAEPYVAVSAGQMPFPVDRMDHENAALTILPEYVANDSSIKLPRIYNYDNQNHVLRMEDGGPRNLKVAYTDPSLDIEHFGKELGRWLANLHRSTITVDIGNNVTAKAMYRLSYTNVAGALQKYGHDPSMGDQINEQYGSLLQSDDACVCHGDFWTGNVMVDVEDLTVVDWEMVRRGCGATDVGQFAAEAYLLDRFKGGRGLLSAFLSAYREDHALDRRFLQRVAVHMGVHLAFWPTRVSWGTDDETKECIDLGYHLMTQAVDNDDNWLKNSLLRDLC